MSTILRYHKVVDRGRLEELTETPSQTEECEEVQRNCRNRARYCLWKRHLVRLAVSIAVRISESEDK
jgi:hypothetical protein